MNQDVETTDSPTFVNVTIGGYILGGENIYSTATQPLNSKGNSFATIQGAIDDLGGDGWVYVPEGTWNEDIVLLDDSVSIVGAGWGTIINGTTTDHTINVSASYCLLRDFQVKNKAGTGTAFVPILGDTAAKFLQIDHVWISESDEQGLRVDGFQTYAKTMFINNTDSHGVRGKDPIRLMDSTITYCGGDGISLGNGSPSSQINACYIAYNTGYGIEIQGGSLNTVVVGNRVTGNGDGQINDLTGGSATVVGNDTD